MSEREGSDRPPFVVVEGLDGAGTSTQCRLLVERLREEGVPALRTREPSSGPVGSLVRQMLAERVVVPTEDGGARPVRSDVLALLFAADRLDHVDAVIRPGLEQGRVVVSDRYYHSSFAYQGERSGGGGPDPSWVRTLNRRALDPDLTVFLRAPASVCLERLEDRGRRDRYEDADELQAMERRYEEIFDELRGEGAEIVTVDATESVESVHTTVYRSVAEVIEGL